MGGVRRYDFSDSFSLRGLFSHLDYDSDLAKSGNRFYGELELLSVGMVLDYHPFGGGFRMTGGAFINGNELIGRARGARMDIGGEAYAGHLDLKVDFDSLAPYLGVGYSGGRGRTGLSLVFDAGVLFQGSPNLSISGNFDQCGFTVDTRGRATLAGSGCASLGSLKADIEEEHRDLTDGLADLKLYPAALLGLSYRF